MTEQEKFIVETKDKIDGLKTNLVEFYGIKTEQTIENWNKLKLDFTEENIETFIKNLTLDDVCNIIKTLANSDYFNVISGTYDIVYMFYNMDKIPDTLKDILIDYIELKKIENVMSKKRFTKNICESKYVDYIEENFDNIFPEYEFVSREYDTKKYGRIDIFAKDKETLKPVIIECKMEHRNPSHQLLRYALAFENPILIGITEEELSEEKKIDGISYLTYKQLGINRQDVE